MEFLIISGLSGAGKTRAADVLEDLDFYCVDNLPVAMLTRFAEFCIGMGGRYNRVALVVDLRDHEGFRNINAELDKIAALPGCNCRILFVEADTGTIVKRYKETRRPHPLQGEAGDLSSAVKLEIEYMAPLRERADLVLNTSQLTLGKLQQEIYSFFVGDSTRRALNVNVISFGFKYGIPIDADMVFDVRFLPNPFYQADLRHQTGLDQEVYDYVFSKKTTIEFFAKLCEMVNFLIPRYVEEGKHNLTIAIGCTGGHHRSVAIARALAEHVNSLGQRAINTHRDIDK